MAATVPLEAHQAGQRLPQGLQDRVTDAGAAPTLVSWVGQTAAKAGGKATATTKPWTASCQRAVTHTNEK